MMQISTYQILSIDSFSYSYSTFSTFSKRTIAKYKEIFPDERTFIIRTLPYKKPTLWSRDYEEYTRIRFHFIKSLGVMCLLLFLL